MSQREFVKIIQSCCLRLNVAEFLKKQCLFYALV